MALENIVCTECAVEFEASEWSFTRECEACRVPVVRRTAEPPNTMWVDIDQQLAELARMQRFYMPMTSGSTITTATNTSGMTFVSDFTMPVRTNEELF